MTDNLATGFLWENSADYQSNSKLNKFINLITEKYHINFDSYHDFYNWSVANTKNLEIFWQEFVNFADIIFDKSADRILKQAEVFNQNHWFVNAKLNFAKNLLESKYNNIRNKLEPEYPALIALNEQGDYKAYSINQLKSEVACVAEYLLSVGVEPGDRVAGFIPNVAQAVIAMLATTAIGAVWTACSPDFGEHGVLERFTQIDPKVLLITDGYFYKNKYFNCHEKNNTVINKLITQNLAAIICIDNNINYINNKINLNIINWPDLLNNKNLSLDYISVDYNDPVYIMFSSGTTGKPKCIVHGVGGVLTEHFKEHLLHHNLSNNLTNPDRFFYFTSTSWMMWHWQISALGLGATIIIYDGAPNFPNDQSLIDLIDKYNITVFGASAKYYSGLEKNNLIPKNTNKLNSLRLLLSTGSPLVDEQYDYIYKNIKSNLALCSISGGTDLLGCLALGNPLVPIYRGELQSRSLGIAVKFYNDAGQEVINQKGELVCTLPFPSMPLYFWNDPDGKIYHQAYFAKYHNIWAHGDYGKLTSHNGVVIYGRSDTVLNPAGIRIGTAEIYAEVEKIPEVIESLAVGQSYQNDERVILFVVLQLNIKLDDGLKNKIKQQIKIGASPRHVPAVIIQVPELPRTTSGKLVELAVKNIIAGLEVKNKSALANPEVLDYFINLVELR